MKLKEAFHYQNVLQEWIDRASRCLNDNSFITKTTETHLKSKAKSDAEDEIVEVAKAMDTPPTVVIDLLFDLIKEKEAVALAICKAKNSSEIDIDTAIEVNKLKQSAARTYRRLTNVNATSTTKRGSDFTFNAEGNQVPYYYNVESETKIDYNRNHVRELSKKLVKECDEASMKIDSILLTTEVEIEATYDVHDTFEEVLEMAAEKKAEAK